MAKYFARKCALTGLNVRVCHLRGVKLVALMVIRTSGRRVRAELGMNEMR